MYISLIALLALKFAISASLFEQAQMAEKQGQMDVALSLYHDHLNEESDSVQTILSIAYLFAQRGEISQAAQYFEMATKIDQDPKILFNLGFAYLQLGQLNDALSVFTRVTEINPLFRPAHVKLASIYRDLGQNDLVVKHLHKFNFKKGSFICFIP